MRDPFNAFCTHAAVTIPGASLGPLAGLTFGAKDNYDVAGYRTGGGSPDWLRTHEPAIRTAPTVEVLIAAGASLVGKTQMDELAFSLAGQNAHYGTPINPRTPDRIPGGSSSGSAVATAGDLVDFAIGTDTAGSVRVPAHNCGVYGFRPTQGRIALEGLIPFSPSFDTVGWFARDAEMLRRVGRILMPTAASVGQRGRLLVADELFAMADKEVVEALRPLMPALAEVIGPQEQVKIGPNLLDAWGDQFNILRGAEVRDTLGDWIDRVQPKFGPGIRERFEKTREITEEMVATARVGRQQTQCFLDDLLGGGNILCVPTAPMRAPLRTSSEAEMARYRAQTLKFTAIATVGGLPQISMPLAAWQQCPVGISLITGRGQDGCLLDLAVEIGRCHGANGPAS